MSNTRAPHWVLLTHQLQASSAQGIYKTSSRRHGARYSQIAMREVANQPTARCEDLARTQCRARSPSLEHQAKEQSRVSSKVPAEHFQTYQNRCLSRRNGHLNGRNLRHQESRLCTMSQTSGRLFRRHVRSSLCLCLTGHSIIARWPASLVESLPTLMKRTHVMLSA